MREIKFRAWSGEKMILSSLYDMVFNDDACCFWDYKKRELMPVMQYTGLKDKNGKEIYEGDILRVELECRNPGYIGNRPATKRIKIKMVYKDGAFLFENLRQGRGHMNWRWKRLRNDLLTELEVIGNIWEKPELKED